MSSGARRRQSQHLTTVAIRLHCVEAKTVKILITFFYTRTDTPTTPNSSHLLTFIYDFLVDSLPCGVRLHCTPPVIVHACRVRARNSEWASFI